MPRKPMLCGVALLLLVVGAVRAEAQLTREKVERAISDAQRFLISQQNGNGSWQSTGQGSFTVGYTSIVTLSLLNSGLSPEEPAVARGLTYLRGIPRNRLLVECQRPTYEISLMTMALAAANQPQDRALVAYLADLIFSSQLTQGENTGSWSYTLGEGPSIGNGDNSNGQFAVLALREAVHYGVPVPREVWERSRKQWLRSQNFDGGWPYAGLGNQNQSRGSMTVAGVSSLVITQSMLGEGDDHLDCCGQLDPDDALEKGIEWLSKNFAVGHNPGYHGNLLYYLYGLERAGRLSGRRFFGEGNDWYRAGAEFLLAGQNKRDGSWRGDGGEENQPILGTSFSLLFLSKGLAPVVVGKLKFGTEVDGKIPDETWNRHPRDVHNLMEYVTALPRWPKLLTWQVVETNKLTHDNAASILSQSPVLYLSSDRDPLFTAEQIGWLRTYLDEGGTLFASADCNSAEFDRGFRELVRQLYPEAPNLFRRLPADHPVYQSEFLLSYDAHEIWGIDFGCRTPVFFVPEDLGCFWSRWSKLDPPGRTPAVKQRIDKTLRVGTNVLAFVTGREPPDKLDNEERIARNGLDPIEQGFLEIAKLRHDGGWDTAPLALRNLLNALDRQVGAVATRKQKDFLASDVAILNYPLLYMHGRQPFSLGEPERRQLREYLQNGGVLFADACCGAEPFDRAFREEMRKLFPDLQLRRIPVEHELFTARHGFDVRQVRRRLPDVRGANQPLDATVQRGAPDLEGIEIDGRLTVIYSRYDISCALEKQVSLVCNGYVPDDALKLAINIVRFAMQDIGADARARR